MIRGLDSVCIQSPKASKLAKFYKEVVGLKTTGEFEMGDKGEEAYIFEFSKTSDLYIFDHPKVKGKTKDPWRSVLNLEVDDIKKEVRRLKRKKVRQIQEIQHMEGYGWYSIFADTDGNYFQISQVRPTPKKK